jgi:hypothetical protein
MDPGWDAALHDNMNTSARLRPLGVAIESLQNLLMPRLLFFGCRLLGFVV